MVRVKYVIVEDFQEKPVACGTYKTHHAMQRGLILQADKQFGRDNWRAKQSPSLPGFYAVGSDA